MLFQERGIRSPSPRRHTSNKCITVHFFETTSMRAENIADCIIFDQRFVKTLLVVAICWRWLPTFIPPAVCELTSVVTGASGYPVSGTDASSTPAVLYHCFVRLADEIFSLSAPPYFTKIVLCALHV